jgi:radical SAM superfamily enzyme YgiQ (UPF0313 family)
MRSLRDALHASFFFFTDLTFNLEPKRAAALCEALIDARLNVHWFAYATVDGLDASLLALMREAGCTRLGIGIESVVEETLSRTKCSLRYRRVEHIQRALEAVDRAGILTRGYLMAGWPWETAEHYDATAVALRSLPLDHVRVAFAVPFAGVSLAGSYPVVTDDLRRYTTNEPVFANATLRPEEQSRLASDLVKNYLNSRAYADHVHEKTSRFPELLPSFAYFVDYLTQRGELDSVQRFPFLDVASHPPSSRGAVSEPC